MWLMVAILDRKALEERDGRVESIFDPSIVTAKGILRLIGGRRRCQVWSFSSQSLPPSDEEGTNALTLSLQVGWGTEGLMPFQSLDYNPELFFHGVTGLGCVYMGPPTQAGTLDVKWELGSHGFHSSHSFPASTLPCAAHPEGMCREALNLPAGGLDISEEVVITEAGNGS